MLLISFTVVFVFSTALKADGTNNQLYFIDAHSQLDHLSGGIEVVLKRMSENNVKKTLLASRSKMPVKDILKFSDEYPNKIFPLLRTKHGKLMKRNPEKYFKKVMKRINAGNFRGNGEILVFHSEKKKQYGKIPAEVAYNFTDKEIMYVMKRVMKKNWPVMLHLEFGALVAGRISYSKGSKLNKKIYLKQLENLLKEYPENSFVLNHLGQLDLEDIVALIRNHQNIYFTTAHTSHYYSKTVSSPWTFIFNLWDKNFKSDWKKLFVNHSDRFIFAMDNVWKRQWDQDYYSGEIQLWRTALAQLPDNVARAIAHKNAERLWDLK